MTKEQLIDRIEALVEEYFEDNDEPVSEVYTLRDPDGDGICLDYDFTKC